MKSVKFTSAGLIAALALSGCASTPTHPTVAVMPAAKKPFQVFEAEQAACNDYAKTTVSGEAESANGKALGATLIGAALGAGLGAAAGGGHGAGVGAAVGGTAGTAIGAGDSSHEQRSIQAQYDNAYAACMTSKGNVVQQPVMHRVVTVVQPVYAAPPPVAYQTPPPGYAPPPPPGYGPPPSGYAPPPGAMAPPPNMPAPQL